MLDQLKGWLRVASWFVALSLCWAIPGWAGESGAKKVIYYGWGMPDTQYVRDNWREMEKMPFDGVGIVIPVDRQAWQRGQVSTATRLGHLLMGTKKFQIEDFRETIVDLKTPQWRIMTDNFLPVYFSAAHSSKGLNWFDDERWGIIAQNFQVAARIAAEGGLKGLIFDPEGYGHALFRYSALRKQLDRPFEEYVRMARQRGRELMTAMAPHLPQGTFLTLYGYTASLGNVNHPKNVRASYADTYALLPAFYDGMLDTMPDGASLVDGYEFAYGFKERQSFVEAYRRIHEGALHLTALPERYRQKVHAGFGLWLDNNKQMKYYTPEEFKRVLRDALEVSDKYVWLYTQGPRFFPPSDDVQPYIKAIAEARQSLK